MLLVFVAGLVCAQTLDDYQRRYRELVVAYLKPLKRRPCWVRNKIEHLLSWGVPVRLRFLAQLTSLYKALSPLLGRRISIKTDGCSSLG